VNTAGSYPSSLKLDAGKKYDIVVYSYNSSEIPPRVSEISDKIRYPKTEKKMANESLRCCCIIYVIFTVILL